MSLVDVVTREELRALAETQGQPSVSIYMPTHPVGPELQQDPIRLRNLLTEAEKRLLALGLRTPEARALLAQADELLPRHAFWQNQASGLALFLADGFFRSYRLPFAVDELLVVGQRLHLKPLLRTLRPDGLFYMLALSQKQVRLLEGSRLSVREVDLEGVPQGLAEALRDHAPDKGLQFHTSTAAPGGRGGERAAMFHGHSGGEEETKTAILRYFHQVDRGLRDWLGARHAPLVLAGVDYLLPLYREANTYPQLQPAGIEGNPDDLRPEDLHARAWEVVRPVIVQPREAAVARYRELAGAASPLASADLSAIVAAAYYGRVEVLFIRMGTQQWGRFDPQTGEVTLDRDPGPENEDVVDLAAVQTYLNSGAVYVVPPEQMPGREAVAALFRY